MPIRGMRPAVKGATPDPLEPGVNYRLLIEAGSHKAEHDFTPCPARPDPRRCAAGRRTDALRRGPAALKQQFPCQPPVLQTLKSCLWLQPLLRVKPSAPAPRYAVPRLTAQIFLYPPPRRPYIRAHNDEQPLTPGGNALPYANLLMIRLAANSCPVNRRRCAAASPCS